MMKLKDSGLTIDGKHTAEFYAIQPDERISVVAKAAKPAPVQTGAAESEAQKLWADFESSVSSQLPLRASSSAADDSADPATITLSIRTPNEEKPKQVRIKRADKMDKIIAAFSTKLGLSPEQLRLSFDGQFIKPDATPESLDLEDEDLIEVTRK